MKRITGVVCSIALIAGLALCVPSWAAGGAGSQQDQSSMNQGTGGGTGGTASSDASVQKSTGGATGAAGGQDMGALKKSLNNRVKAVDKEISSAKKSAGDMPQAQKDAMQLQIDQVQAKRDSVKKMISDMKRADQQSTVETAMADLEQSAKQLSSGAQRSTPAGGSDSSSGGATGGSSSDTGMDQGTGGATGGAAPGMSLNAMKTQFNDRVDKVGRDLDDVKKKIDAMQGTQKDTMQMELDKVTAKQAAAKKIIGDMKDASEQAEVESAVADLEQSAKTLQSKIGRSSPAGDSKSGSSSSSSQSKGGATGGSSSGASQQQQSTGGAAGGASGQTMSLNAIKQNFNDRVDKVSRDLKDVQKSIKNMPGTQKDTMQLQLDRVMGETAGVKKMIADMNKVELQSEVEKAVADLESSAKMLSSQTQRSTPAGETQSGGATGGSSMSTSTGTAVNQSTGGVTGGAAGGTGTMQFSYDQRAQFRKTANTKLDSLDRRIDMLKQNAKLAPQDVNSNVMPKVDQLSKMSGDIKSKINKVENSDRQAWNTTRTDINESLNNLETSLMDAEKTIS